MKRVGIQTGSLSLINRSTGLFSWVAACSFLASCIATGSIHPEAERLNGEGVRRLDAGRLREAEVAFQLSLEFSPCFGDALHNLALIELMRRNLEGAERRETEALSCRPDLVQAISGIGAIRLQQRDPDSALYWFARAIAADPGYLDARRNLILTYFELGQPDRARAEIERLKVLAPTDPWVTKAERVLTDGPQ